MGLPPLKPQCHLQKEMGKQAVVKIDKKIKNISLSFSIEHLHFLRISCNIEKQRLHSLQSLRKPDLIRQRGDCGQTCDEAGGCRRNAGYFRGVCPILNRAKLKLNNENVTAISPRWTGLPAP